MTQIDFEQLAKDREAGTCAPWSVPHFARDEINCDCLYVLAEYGGMGSIATIDACDEMEGPWGDDVGPPASEAQANARRIARVPDLEAFALSAKRQLEAAEQLAEACWKFSAEIDNPNGRPGSARVAMLSALAAYEAAKGGDT